MPSREVGNPARSWVTWLVSHGIARRALLTAGRKGDLLARLAMDPRLREDPFASYEVLRARGAVVPGTLVAGTVDHAGVNQVLRGDDFSVAGGHGELPAVLQWLIAKAFDPWATGPVDPPSMLALDPPDHTRHRRLVARAFTARRVTALEETVVSVADRLVDELAAGPTSTDLVDRFAAQLPVAIIAELLGVPKAEHAQLLAWGNVAAVSLDPGLSWRQYREAERAIRQLHTWFESHLARLRRNPGDDLLSALVTLEGPDAPTELELHAIGLLVLGAGFETTVNLIGNAVVQLDRHAEQRAIVLDDAELMGNAVEEVLRYDSPVQLTLRQAVTDTEVAGVRVPAGQPVLCFLGGANRDPAVFADPQRFDVARTDADQHVAFSAGVHYCLGASLARLETRVALQTLYARFPDLTVSGAPERRATRVLRGYEHIPVSLGARRLTTA